MVPGRGGGPTLSGGGFRFAIPTGTPDQAFLSSTSVTRSRSEGGGSRTFRVRTPVANGLVLLSRVGVGFRGSWAWIHNLVMIRLLVLAVRRVRAKTIFLPLFCTCCLSTPTTWRNVQ